MEIVIEYIKKCFKGISSALDVIDIIAVCVVATIIFLSVPFYFVNQVTYNFLLLVLIIYIFSKYILPRFVRLFKTRIFLKTLESKKNTTN